MCFQHALGQGLAINRKAVVHAGDLDLAGFQVFNRVVGAVVAVVHLDGFAAQRQGQHLVAQADAKNRQICLIKNAADHWHRVAAGGGRVAGAVRQEHAIGGMGQHLVGGGRGGQHGDVATGRGKAPQDISLGAEIYGNHLEFGVVLPRVACGPGPAHFIPAIGLCACHILGQIQPLEPGKAARARHQRLDVKDAFGVMAQRHMRRALLANGACQAAGVDAADSDAPAPMQPGRKMLCRAPVAGLCRVPFHHHARGHRIGGFIIVGVYAHIADMGKGKGDNLPGIRGVCHNFLIARHGGVKAKFRLCRACGTKAAAVKHCAISERKAGGWAGGRCLRHGGILVAAKLACSYGPTPHRSRVQRLLSATALMPIYTHSGPNGKTEPAMDMRDRVNSALKQAMKDKQPERLSTLRLINAAIKDRDIDARSDGNDEGVPDSEILAILGKMAKQRQESARAYEEGGRLDLAERERAEIVIIEEFLPRQLSQAEVAKAIDAAVAEIGAQSIRDMGKVMAALKAKYTGQMDFGAVGPAVKDRLSA